MTQRQKRVHTTERQGVRPHPNGHVSSVPPDTTGDVSSSVTHNLGLNGSNIPGCVKRRKGTDRQRDAPGKAHAVSSNNRIIHAEIDQSNLCDNASPASSRDEGIEECASKKHVGSEEVSERYAN